MDYLIVFEILICAKTCVEMYSCSTVAPVESDADPTKRNLAKDFEVEDTDTRMAENEDEYEEV